MENDLEFIFTTFNKSNVEIAGILGISSRGTISDWIKGRSKVPKKRGEQLSKHFKIPQELFTRKLTEDEKSKIRLMQFGFKYTEGDLNIDLEEMISDLSIDRRILIDHSELISLTMNNAERWIIEEVQEILGRAAKEYSWAKIGLTSIATNRKIDASTKWDLLQSAHELINILDDLGEKKFSVEQGLSLIREYCKTFWWEDLEKLSLSYVFSKYLNEIHNRDKDLDYSLNKLDQYIDKEFFIELDALVKKYNLK